MIKILLLVLGCVCVALGMMGIFIPLLPTTPFLLLAAWCFARSSPKLYQKLIQNKWFGPIIVKYREQGVISIPVKIVSVSTLWILIGYSILKVIPHNWVKGLVFLIAVGTSWFILKHPSRPSNSTSGATSDAN